MNQWNVKNRDYKKAHVMYRTKASMDKTTAMAIQKTLNQEIAHPWSLASTKYTNYLEDQKAKRYKDKIDKSAAKRKCLNNIGISLFLQ